MVQISEVKGNKRDNRTAAHTHIKGLGLKSDGHAEAYASGFIGQIQAREVGTFATKRSFLATEVLAANTAVHSHAESLSI